MKIQDTLRPQRIGTGRKIYIRSSVILMAFLMAAMGARSLAWAENSLSVTHSPPDSVKAGNDLVLHFEVSGDCENRQVSHDASVTKYPDDNHRVEIFEAEVSVEVPKYGAEISVDVPTGCGPREADLTFWNSAGATAKLSPEHVSHSEEGSSYFLYRIPGVDVTPGTLTYRLSAQQSQSSLLAIRASDTFFPYPLDPNDPTFWPDDWGVWSGDLPVYGTYEGSLEVPSDESSNTKPGKGRGSKK